jgi:hypothetical protein
MENYTFLFLSILAIIAFLYASVGHGGAVVIWYLWR